jgi:hypothetical protein
MKPIVIRVAAPHNTFGNPRRVWVALHPATGNVIRTLEEGYADRQPVDEAFGFKGWIEALTVDSTAAEYKRLMRREIPNAFKGPLQLDESARRVTAYLFVSPDELRLHHIQVVGDIPSGLMRIKADAVLLERPGWSPIEERRFTLEAYATWEEWEPVPAIYRGDEMLTSDTLGLAFIAGLSQDDFDSFIFAIQRRNRNREA